MYLFLISSQVTTNKHQIISMNHNMTAWYIKVNITISSAYSHTNVRTK